MFFRPTTSCKWSVCGTVTGDSWMRHRTSRYFLSAYALPTLDIFAIDWPTLGLAIHTPLQSLPTRDPSSDSACASLRDPVHQHYPRHTLQKTEASYKKKNSSRLTSCGASGNVSVALLFFFPHRRRLRLRLREARAREACEASSRPRGLTWW